MSQPTYTTVTIANGATAASAYETKGAERGSFQLPAAMTGTTITINVSNDAATWTACPIEGNEINPITSTAASKTYSLPTKAFNFRYIQLVSGSAEAAARSILICTRD